MKTNVPGLGQGQKKTPHPPLCNRPQALKSVANKSHKQRQTLFVYSRPTSLCRPRRGWQRERYRPRPFNGTRWQTCPSAHTAIRHNNMRANQHNPPPNHPHSCRSLPLSLSSQPGSNTKYLTCVALLPAAQLIFGRKIKHGHFGEDERSAKKKKHVRHTIHDTHRPFSYTGHTASSLR